MLEVKPAQERLPQPVGVTGAGAGARPPQPPGLWVAVPGQVINGQPDQGPLDDGQLAVMVLPGGPAGQPGVQPVPGLSHGGAVPGGLGDGGHLRPWPAPRAASLNSPPCRAGRPRPPARGGAAKYSTRSERSRPSSSAGRSASSTPAWSCRTRRRRQPGWPGRRPCAGRPRSAGRPRHGPARR